MSSVVFVVSPFLILRSYSHDYLALYFSVPLGAVVPFLFAAANNESELKRSILSPFVLLALVVVATSGLYYAFFTAMFVGLVAAAKSFERRSAVPILLAASFCAALFVLLIAAGYGTALFDLARGRLSEPKRWPFEQLSYGLLLSTAMQVYADIGLWVPQFSYYKQVFTPLGTSEWPGVVLTSIILIAPVVFFIGRTFRTRGRDVPLFWVSTMLITFGIIFCLRGGLGYVFNHVVSGAIRAQERVLPFLMFFAIVIFCSIVRYISQRKPIIAGRCAAFILVAILFLSVSSTFGGLRDKQYMYFSAVRQTDTKSIIDMLSRKNQAGLLAVLQLPHVAWPELAPVRNFQLYRHQLPYLHDLNDSPTKWSYGLTGQQPEFAAVRDIVQAGQSPRALPERARSIGFDGILIEKAAYSPEDAAALIRTMEDGVGGACKLFEDELRALFAIAKDRSGHACHRQVPLPPERTLQFSFGAGENGPSLLSRGWSVPEAGFTWGEGDTSIVSLPRPNGTENGRIWEVSMSLTVFKPTETDTKTIVFSVAGERLGEWVVGPGSARQTSLRLVVPARLTDDRWTVPLTIHTSRPERPQVPGGGVTRLLGVALHRLTIDVLRPD